MTECPKCEGELIEKKKEKFECQNCGTKFFDLEAARKYSSPSKDRPEKEKSSRLINCKDCGSEISTKARTCPQCGADFRSWWGRRHIITKLFLIYIGLSFISAFFVVFSILSSISEETASTATTAETASLQHEILDISYYEFDSLFGMEGSLTDVQKEALFENEYKGKYVQWRCELRDITEPMFRDDYAMSLRCKPSSFSSDMTVYLRPDQKEKALNLDKGSYVEFVAKLYRYGELMGHRAEDGVIVN